MPWENSIAHYQRLCPKTFIQAKANGYRNDIKNRNLMLNFPKALDYLRGYYSTIPLLLHNQRDIELP